MDRTQDTKASTRSNCECCGLREAEITNQIKNLVV